MNGAVYRAGLRPGTPTEWVAAFAQLRQRSQWIFDLLTPEAYWVRPIPLRHPFVFYDGHLDAFTWNTLFARILGEGPMDARLDALFERGIDPGSTQQAAEKQIHQWPEVEAIRAYKTRIQERLNDWILNEMPTAQLSHPGWENGRLLDLLLEHEMMHQETLLYMVHQLPESLKRRPPETTPPGTGRAANSRPAPTMVTIPSGNAFLGSDRDEFAWDNERPTALETVPRFDIDSYPVTNGEFLAFVEAGGYQQPQWWTLPLPSAHPSHPLFWRKRGETWEFQGLFGPEPLPLDCPVWVTQAEARAYARFVGKHLPTEAQWHRAAYGEDPTRPYPWGHEPITPARANVDLTRLGPVPVGSCPDGASPFGVQDLVGTSWEWTRTPFAPFPGFQPSAAYPQYSADFFDGRHFVLKGGSWATDARLVRASFRNWFYSDYPYLYAQFRCVLPAE
jgi:ergothioneine biosynthesis protein EgtB